MTKPIKKAKQKAKTGDRPPTSAVASGEAPAKARKAAVHYSPELGQRICDAVGEGATLEKVCAGPGMPSTRAVRQWTQTHEEFAAAMETARELRAEATFEAMVALEEEIKAGKVQPNEGRVIFDMMKFRVQQDGRRRYGDKGVAVDVKLGVAIQGDRIDTAKWIEGVLAGADRTNVVPLLPPRKEPTE